MKASIEAPDFADGLKIAAGLTRANSHLLAHGCIFIEATTDGIFVTGGDGESYIRVPCGGEVFEPGDVLVPAKTVAKAVSLMEGNVDLTLDDDDSLGIETMTSRITLPTAPAESYPRLNWEGVGEAVAFDAWDLLSLITYAADGREGRHRSITFFPEGKAEAFSGTRLAFCLAPEGLDFGILRSTLDFAAKTFGESEVTIATSGGAAIFSSGGISLWTTLPQYDRKPLPMNLDLAHNVTLDRKALLEGLGLMVVIKEGDEVPVRIDVANGELHMHASSPGQGMVATAIPVDGDLPYATGLTLSHARDVMTRCSGERVTLEFSVEPNKPIRVVEGSVTHILNPNRKAVELNKVDL